MHEAAFAISLLDQVLEQARLHSLSRITEVHVDLGLQLLVIPEALQTAFRAASRDTLAADARLSTKEVPIRAHCRSCASEYPAALDEYRCPNCGRAEAELVAGHEMILVSLEGEREN
ncbi:MAG TPA: hydrogenase maturation nickel metallochaperone HypA [Candidatus Krumholzibacteria bacterium]|nr:hydrogenase maturation nickel metallochaperone HypA [Candidatus Krumholzibacteria bacterium]